MKDRKDEDLPPLCKNDCRAPKLWMILSYETRNEPTKLFRRIQNTSHDQGKGTSRQNTARGGKARSNNQSFWLMGQPDVEVRKLPSPPVPLPQGEGRDWYEVEVNGFDYFDTAKGELVSGGKNKIAVWSLDTDYDER